MLLAAAAGPSPTVQDGASDGRCCSSPWPVRCPPTPYAPLPEDERTAGMQINAVLMFLNPACCRRSTVAHRGEPAAGRPGKFAQIGLYGFPILLLLLVTGILGDILRPLVRLRFALQRFDFDIPCLAERVLPACAPLAAPPRPLPRRPGKLGQAQAEYPCSVLRRRLARLTTDHAITASGIERQREMSRSRLACRWRRSSRRPPSSSSPGARARRVCTC